MKGRDRRAIPAADTGKEEVSVLVCLMAPPTVELIIHHQLLSFPWGVQRRLLLAWEICFL